MMRRGKSRNKNSPRYRRIRIYSTIAFIITKFSQKLRKCISSNIPEVFYLYFRYFVALANLIKIYKDSFKGQTSSLNCVRWGIWRESVCVQSVGYPQYDFKLSKMNICALWRCRPMPTTSVLLDMAKSDQNGGFWWLNLE